MKKFFALTLAVAMVLSLASVSMAAVTVNPGKGSDYAKLFKIDNFYTFDKNKDAGDKWAAASTTSEEFGTTLYLPLLKNVDLIQSPNWNPNEKNDRNVYVTDSDAVKGLKVSAKWEKNGDYVKSVELVKVDSLYALAIATTGTSYDLIEVLGEISVKGKSYWEDTDGKVKKEAFEHEFDVQIDLAWPGQDGKTHATDEMVVKAKTIYNFEEVNVDDAEDFVIYFGDAKDVEVETNVKNTKKVLLGNSNKVNDDIVDAYVDADLEFYTLTGSFRRTATVTIAADEGSYLYENKGGELVEVKAEYDEWEEAFTFKTKTLGAYVVSNMKLDTTAAVETTPANPSTGAAA